MARLVRAKQDTEKSSRDSGKKINKHFEFKFGFMVGLKDDYRDVTWEQMQQEIRELLQRKYPGGNFTAVGGYILIDGRACYPQDFDYEAMDRKPGTKPPLYTLTPEEQKQIQILERLEREGRLDNALAKNPSHLFTSKETDRLREFRQKKGSKPVTEVEWTEQDADDESIAEEETAKALKSLPPTFPLTRKEREPVKRLRRAR